MEKKTTLYLHNLFRPTTTTTSTITAAGHHHHHQPQQQQQQQQPFSGKNDSTQVPDNVVKIGDDELQDDGEDDSFFELELTVPDFDYNSNTINNNNTNNNCRQPLDTHTNNFDYSSSNDSNIQHKFQHPTLSLSPSDFLFKRKILPIEPISSRPPHTPTTTSSLLKSAPRFRVLMFKKSKSVAAHAKKTEKTGETEHRKQDSSRFFTVKFKLHETNSTTATIRQHIASEESFPDDSSRRFSKELVHKYLKLINPLYIKVSRKHNDKTKFSGSDLSVPSPSCSPAATAHAPSPKKEKHGNIPAGIRVVCKHLGKSKSASATTGMVISRRDDSLLLQHDGIQSAILHCKNSFNSSRSDSSLLSRFASDESMASPRISSEENGIK